MSFNLKGAFSALLTPFYNQRVDFESLQKHVEFQIKNGITGFVVNGTTAESPTLSWTEVEEIFACVKKVAGPKFPIILGTGSNSTQATVETTRKACQLGADAVLVVVPYYNKPPQRGLVQHFVAVAAASTAPVILYNVPGRTITALSVESISELAKQKNIVGIKEASGDLAFVKDVFSAVPNSFIKLSGDDITYLPFLKLGGQGIISVMSNIIPKECMNWTNHPQESEVEFNRYLKLIQGMYVEANPIVPKWMLYKMGIFRSPEMRLPLVELELSLQSSTEKLLKEFSLV
ncbi:MAG: 4-hydroxy-tetrahydrodipicolinate synthase [Bdellovibrionales bacterium RIFCSPHIGHO2_01_FULL_40_29]|nr:MAG: 4-hydroxy-tetrahydrodipicolinate synthase [Bdellovibrionales bacterium RIFCSPHIGHO2_01_FULL_40_29]OFZ33167.1 MAG: 4-hydroxy-tetrahydrodipicolinate synthase [Bdellovibrionales bacterium RIFCSPHIGHO2_02_FULL_40_15]